MAGGSGRTLEQTPTWAVAVVCLVLVIISIFIEHLIELVGKWLARRHKRALSEALEKVKSELMLLGFISLLLTIGQGPISNICVSQKVGNSWHPCPNPKSSPDADSSRRKLLQFPLADHSRRILAATAGDKCAEKGKVSLISTDGIHQLHIFIFVLAVFHVGSSVATWALGKLKMRRWQAWEKETKTIEYQFTNDPQRFRFARDTSFGRRHLNSWSNSRVLTWIVCFFRQFVWSVPKVDFLTLRHGFIMAHLAPHSAATFNFQQYIDRSLEGDFKVVVGINPMIWFFAVFFLLANAHGWRAYLWLPFIPLVVILLVGTKLQVVITRMALQIMERGDVVRGVPLVQPKDDHFWFNRPKLLLYVIHFVLFQNAFQLAFFIYSLYEFGWNSCFAHYTADTAIRISVGVVVQVLCSYVTLPLYALVTQMGSTLKPSIFNDRVALALKQWHRTAKKRVKEQSKSGTATPASSRPGTPPHRMSPVHLLKYHRSEVADSFKASTLSYGSDNERLDGDGSVSPPPSGSVESSVHHRQRGDGPHVQEEDHEVNAHHAIDVSRDFSFSHRTRP
ncbi:MLO-like protein 2 [Wolffia australiana]